MARDLTGTRSNMLTVVCRAENSPAGEVRWLCRCDCGTEVIIQRGALTSNGTKSCGCIKRRRGPDSPLFDDKTGKRYGGLTVLGFARIEYVDQPNKKQGRRHLGQERVTGGHQARTYWFCKCDCGNSAEVLGGTLTGGRTTSCGCHIERAKRRRKYEDNERAAVMYLLLRYKNNARVRSIEWNLTEEKFKELIFLNCFICGAEPEMKVAASKRRITTLANGIDRVDNTRGYHPDNVAPCCKTCNIAKKDMSLSDFLAWITRVAAYQISVGQVLPDI